MCAVHVCVCVCMCICEYKIRYSDDVLIYILIFCYRCMLWLAYGFFV